MAYILSFCTRKKPPHIIVHAVCRVLSFGAKKARSASRLFKLLTTLNSLIGCSKVQTQVRVSVVATRCASRGFSLM